MLAAASASAGGAAPSARAVARHRMPQISADRLAAVESADLKHRGRRVGIAQRADLTPAADGSWSELKGGNRIWRIELQSPGARWLVLGFDRFYLPDGASLTVHRAQASETLGPFTAADERPDGRLWLAPLSGDTATIELIWPVRARASMPALRLRTVSHGVRDAWGAEARSAFTNADRAGSCNVDVNCPLGNEWQEPKRGVVQLLIGGTRLCSGSLINTTADDCRPYLLTAEHCVGSAEEAASTLVRFNYEHTLCENGDASTDQIQAGASLLASWRPSDFALLELDEAPPPSFAPYYNGWSRSPLAATESWSIHHPGGGTKKISYNADALIPGQASGWGADHWRVTDWEQGTTEAGSSGSPLFGPDRRIVGQLHGGVASCLERSWDEYGRFDVSWTGGSTSDTSLAGWLDPAATGLVVTDGNDGSACGRRDSPANRRVDDLRRPRRHTPRRR